MAMSSGEEEEPSVEVACSRVDGHRLDRLYICVDPGDHVEEARGWWNSDASVRSYRWTASRTLATGAELGEGGATEGEDEEAANDDKRCWLRVGVRRGPRHMPDRVGAIAIREER
ncbi:hypothetical protein B296_00003407 [Ensete ventricosum]|uniref:Uncharacterized protein n=1 Tax=Ensete ventricosum TaxID=4639 RepID=A0A427B623_ENSVE|nr:hypothetical protein B296_00003407 [Ensete ventricosum]